MNQEMESLASELGVPDFDLMLVGDGSGTTAEKTCGFACFAYNRRSGESKVHYGALSHGTNNLAELMPYIHALWHYHVTANPINRVRVLIVSDSEVTVRQGQGVYGRNANACWWNAVNWFEKNGYVISWRHVRRNTNTFSKLCDRHAGKLRKDFPIRLDGQLELN